MKTLKNIFLTSILLIFSLNANASVNDYIISSLKSYSWYEKLENYGRKNNGERKLDYYIRLSIVRYLEDIGLYNAGDTKNCNDSSRNSVETDTCYKGTLQQNMNLSKTLKNPEVQDILGKVSFYTIVSIQEGVMLEHILSRQQFASSNRYSYVIGPY